MTTVVTRLFDTYEHARQAVQDLEASGIPHSEISLVASNADNRHGTYAPGTDALSGGAAGGYAGDTTTAGAYGEPVTAPGAGFGVPGAGTIGAGAPTSGEAESTGAGAGATIGTILGGGAGLLAGLGLLAIPGVGPLVAAGWLVATLTGAGVGAAGGGILGSLVGAGVPEEHAHVYAEGVRRGGTLVTVRADDAQRTMVEQIMNRYTPVDVDARGAEYRAGGWSRFDEAAPAYTAGGSPTMGTSAVTGSEATGLAEVNATRPVSPETSTTVTSTTVTPGTTTTSRL
jgi:hypothetical protein